MGDKRRPLCIYHKNCLDGRGAAAVIQRIEKDCDFVAMQYGMQRPAVLGRKLYIVDFGMPLPEMRALRAEADEVIWIDHHSSQQGIRDTLGWGTLDTNECGASLAWKTLFPAEPPPPVLAYIRDKDLWRWQLPDSRAIAAGLEMTWKGDHFAGILDADLEEMARKGRPALEALAKRVAEAVKQGVAFEAPYGLAGRRAMVLKCNQDLNDIGEHICLPPTAGGLGYDLAILCHPKRDGGWVHSLRSAGDTGVDCAKIASARGGGGHFNASSYMAPTMFPHLALPAPAAPPAA